MRRGTSPRLIHYAGLGLLRGRGSGCEPGSRGRSWSLHALGWRRGWSGRRSRRNWILDWQSREHALEVLALDGLALDELGGEQVEDVTVFREKPHGRFVRVLDQHADFSVDGLGRLLAVVLLLTDLPAQEDHLFLMPKGARPER